MRTLRNTMYRCLHSVTDSTTKLFFFNHEFFEFFEFMLVDKHSTKGCQQPTNDSNFAARFSS